jgi:hypothetical protein
LGGIPVVIQVFMQRIIQLIPSISDRNLIRYVHRGCVQPETIETISINYKLEELRMKELTMKQLSASRLLQVSAFIALIPVLLGLLFFGHGVASAQAATGPQLLGEFAAQRCDGNLLMHEATNRYRMIYDAPYAAAQRIASATNRYRMIYDAPYAAAQRIASATDRFCVAQVILR